MQASRFLKEPKSQKSITNMSNIFSGMIFFWSIDKEIILPILFFRTFLTISVENNMQNINEKFVYNIL